MNLKQINWGIIGCGDVTELKSGPAFNKVEHSKLVAVMRRNAALAEDYAKRHGVPKWYSDANSLINNPEVNAIYVATTPNFHASYAIQAMKAGKPVYVEKPMAMNFDECQEMLRVSEETGMPLFVAYYRRTLPAFLKVKELLDAATIGIPLKVNIRLYRTEKNIDIPEEKRHWHFNPEIGGAGRFFDLASHQFDYLDYLFGKITEVHGIAQNLAGYYRAEDTVSASFIFESGVVGTGSWCFVVDEVSYEDTIEIIGTKGKIVFSCFEHGEVKLSTSDGSINFSFKNPENIQHLLIKQVVQELQGQGVSPSTGQSGARTNWVLDEIVKSYYNKQNEEDSH